MVNITLSIKEWVRLKEEGNNNNNVPIWFCVISSSMCPFIRPFKDKVMLVSIDIKDYKKGDIVLLPKKTAIADYCLHRIFKVNGDYVQTLGDACRYPDEWINRNLLLGKVILIKRGNLTIDCETLRWKMVFKIWNLFWKIRPTMLSLIRQINKCRVNIGKILKK